MLAPDASIGPAAADLAADLRALAVNQRRQVLASLSPAEQARVSALLEPVATPAPGTLDATPATRPAFARYSPWLARQLQELQSGSTGLEAGWTMTPAARRLLLQIAAEEARDDVPPADQAATGSPSLLGALGGLLARRARV
ncbi:MAG TPA: hypothetical protein VEZ48_13265 [Sphingomonadaceae bacterium]|jgi:hypothetical protein|nr:hypothetical protein [Sphingomonadaceae bacterium]